LNPNLLNPRKVRNSNKESGGIARRRDESGRWMTRREPEMDEERENRK
jgi:hypothetical protein